MIRRVLRRAVETSPFLAECYRTLRDLYVVRRGRPQTSPFGFRFLGESAMSGEEYEPEMTRLCRRLFDEVELFVDVGANIGYYTCLARQAGVRVMAIEPSTANLRFLVANLTANGWYDVEVWAAAVAAAPGLGDLYGSRGGASLLRGWKPGVAETHRETVPVTTLDTLLNGRFVGRNLLIKVDVEGAQLQALRGATATLARRPAPSWLVEVTPSGGALPKAFSSELPEAFELFWSLGYRAYAVEGGLTPFDPETLRGWLSDGIDDRAVNFLFTVTRSGFPSPPGGRPGAGVHVARPAPDV